MKKGLWEERLRKLEDAFGLARPVAESRMTPEQRTRLAEIFAKGEHLFAGLPPLPPWPKRPLDPEKRNAWLKAIFERGKGRKLTLDVHALRVRPTPPPETPGSGGARCQRYVSGVPVK